jgi:hypothetical protein
MVSPAHHGVNGHGKAPHWRLTEEYYQGKEPTRDFIRWDGSPFAEKRNRSRGRDGGHSATRTGATLVPDSTPATGTSDSRGGLMSESGGDSHGGNITTLTTGLTVPNLDLLSVPDSPDLRSAPDPELLSAFEAFWAGPRIAIALKWLPTRLLYQPAAKRPDELARARYLAACHQVTWEQVGQPALAAAA